MLGGTIANNSSIGDSSLNVSLSPSSEISPRLVWVKEQILPIIPAFIRAFQVVEREGLVQIVLYPYRKLSAQEYAQVYEKVSDKLSPLETDLIVWKNSADFTKINGFLKPTRESIVSIDMSEQKRSKLRANDSDRPKKAKKLSLEPRVSEIADTLHTDIMRTLPLGVEPSNIYRYQVPLTAGVFNFIIVQAYIPEEKESSIAVWRKEF